MEISHGRICGVHGRFCENQRVDAKAERLVETQTAAVEGHLVNVLQIDEYVIA